MFRVIFFKTLGLLVASIALFVISGTTLAQQALESETGKAAWYGKKFDGRTTASGDIFDSRKLTAAHPTLPFGTEVKITNADNGKSVSVKITDRGPSKAMRKRGIIIDLSQRAAEELDYIKKGLTDVELKVISLGE